LDVVVLPEQQCSSVRNDAAGGTELIAQLRGFSIAAIGQGNKEKVVSCGMIRVARTREGRAARNAIMQRFFVAVLTVASVVIYSWLCMRAIPLLALRMEPVLVVPGGPP
jgi:hypothetical protein